MERPTSDYLTVSDLSRPRQTPLQKQLEKIDPSIIKHGIPSRHRQAGPSAGASISLFEISLLAFREIILNRLWKSDARFHNEGEFCKHQWDIAKPRKALLIEYAELLRELSEIPVRPRSEPVCKALAEASVQLQPAVLQRVSIAPELWKRILRAWHSQHGPGPSNRVNIEGMTSEFVDSVVMSERAKQQQQQQQRQQQQQQHHHQQQQQQQQQQHHHHHRHQHQQQQQSLSIAGSRQPVPQTSLPLQSQSQPYPPVPLLSNSHSKSQSAPFQQHSSSSSQFQYPSQSSVSQNGISQSTHSAQSLAPAQCGPNVGPSNPSALNQQSAVTVAFEDRYSELLTDRRRFNAPYVVLERILKFFGGVPQMDSASFDGTEMECPISVPFPLIMDSDSWQVPESNPSNICATLSFSPIQSCFLHVPILPSKRRYETEAEVVLLDDTRLAGHMNSKLWEEFANGNVVEAITLIPTSSTWFGRTELADWPCVVMSGLKFEQANTGDTVSKQRYSEVHSYIVVFLGRDPIRQRQFVQLFQDLGIAPPSDSRGSTGLDGADSARWITGFRRLFREHGQLPKQTAQSWNPSQDDDDEDLMDPRVDDIYSILPPHKKPRLERVGRPSDTTASWHHIKRRKMDDDTFSKLKRPEQDKGRAESDAEMSE